MTTHQTNKLFLPTTTNENSLIVDKNSIPFLVAILDIMVQTLSSHSYFIAVMQEKHHLCTQFILKETKQELVIFSRI